MIQVTEEAWLGLKEEVKFLRAENDRLREQVAGLTAALTDAKSSLAFVRTWSKYIDLQGLLTTTPLKEDFWAWAEGWDCDLELRIDAALTASPAPTPAREE
jgi:hypothetical protein